MVDDPKGDKPYTGPERRHVGERRQAADRRGDIRWEPSKEPRRSGKDRRKGNRWVDTPTR